MILSRFTKTLFQSKKKSCAAIFKDVKKRRPGKADSDYLKFVLLSKPPLDYQEDHVIENILKEFRSINDLENFICDVQKDETLWALRNKNLKRKSKELTMRNNEFFKLFLVKNGTQFHIH